MTALNRPAFCRQFTCKGGCAAVVAGNGGRAVGTAAVARSVMAVWCHKPPSLDALANQKKCALVFYANAAYMHLHPSSLLQLGGLPAKMAVMLRYAVTLWDTKRPRASPVRASWVLPSTNVALVTGLV